MELVIGAVILVIICRLLWEGTKAAVEVIAAARPDAAGPIGSTLDGWASRLARPTPGPNVRGLARRASTARDTPSRLLGTISRRIADGRARGQRDREAIGPVRDDRGPLGRIYDRWRTCPECGHGGAVPAGPRCDCYGPRCWCGTGLDTDDPAPLSGPTPGGQPADPPATGTTEGDTPVTTTPAPNPGAPGAPNLAAVGQRPNLTPMSGPGASAGGGVAAAEFTLHDLLDMLGRAERQLTYAAEQIGSLQMGARTVAAIVTARDLAVSARQTVVAEHGRMLDAARDTAAVGRSEGYVAR